jgi:hypothetical protein
MRKITKRSAAVATGAVLAVAGGTAAFAVASGWFSGSGTVYASSSTIKTVQATVDTRSLSNLYPGKSVKVVGTVNNPNDFSVQIDTISLSSLISNKSGCGAGEAKLSFGAVPAGTLVPAGTSPTTVDLGTLTMGTDAAAACAGATFSVSASMTGEIASSQRSGRGGTLASRPASDLRVTKDEAIVKRRRRVLATAATLVAPLGVAAKASR